MGHYDSAYEYDERYGRDDPTNLKIKEDKSQKNIQISKLVYELKNVTSVRLLNNEDGNNIVIDIDKMPTYSFKIPESEANYLLMQILDDLTKNE